MSELVARARVLVESEAAYRSALYALVLSHAQSLVDSEGHWPEPDMGCPHCTAGVVPNNSNTGLCAYHNAKRLLGMT